MRVKTQMTTTLTETEHHSTLPSLPMSTETERHSTLPSLPMSNETEHESTLLSLPRSTVTERWSGLPSLPRSTETEHKSTLPSLIKPNHSDKYSASCWTCSQEWPTSCPRHGCRSSERWHEFHDSVNCTSSLLKHCSSITESRTENHFILARAR